VPLIDVLDVESPDRLELDPLAPGRGGCVSTLCWYGKGGYDDNEKKWEALRTISLGASQKEISSSQHVHYTKDESCGVWLQCAVGSHRPAMGDKSVRPSLCRVSHHVPVG
jgi:hypothetical protein